LSWTQYESLAAERLDFNRTVQLVDMLQRGSVRSLQLTREALFLALRKENGSSLEKYLQEGEVVVIHADLGRADQLQLENDIVDKLTAYIRNRSSVELKASLDSLLSELPGLVAVRKANSILLYVYRETIADMDTLTRLLVSGRLQHIIKDVCNVVAGSSLLGIDPTVKLHDQQQFDESHRQLQLIAESHQEGERCSALDVTPMQSLPWELHEMLLVHCACLLAKTLLKTDARPDIQVVNTLASVCQRFYTVLTARRWLARILRRRKFIH
jgi:hypothetical protein